MVKISVLTPTIRSEGLAVVEKSLKRQTFQDFEWLIGSTFMPKVNMDKWIVDDFTGGVWSLNRIYNKLIREARGELLVSWQDFTAADPDALEKFYFHYTTKPESLVTAVGNKYNSLFPPVGMTWKDPRERNDFGTLYETVPNNIEWNLCSVPKKAMYDIGGFDEEMDQLGYGMDGYAVNERLEKLGGYSFWIDQTLKSYSLEHGRVKDWDENNLIYIGYDRHIRDLIDSGTYPVLQYLQSFSSEKEGGRQ